VRQYLGSGPAAEQAAAADAQRRLEHQHNAEQCRAAADRHATLTAPLDELCRLTDL
jgi:hypothetical protein